MTNYDFLNLSPYEFEGLSRDLLQAHLKLHLESFGPGADQGIDLRYAKGSQFIVQCKRYHEYDSLFQTLKKEIVTVKNLNPSRYILVTNLALSPERKQRIRELFNPFIGSSDDIFGKEDLNNLLQQHPQIEQNHFKLWLSSTNILQTILNRQIINQSKFVLDEIREKLKVYVQNSSFAEALEILTDNRYLIISGIPGIGKTTLAEVLVYDALANGYEQFIYLSDSINEGFAMFDEGSSQVFLFDDFLGSNFLENTLDTNEEKQIIRFIKKIQASKNKLLIFTTREYILNQAKLKFEELDRNDFVKCILDISKYTTIVKAQILYNHLFFNDIPYRYIEELIKRNYLLQIVKHNNYSPRIIQYLSAKKAWENYSVSEFPDALLNMFKSPFEVWGHAFDNQITSEAKIVLYSLLLCGQDVPIANLYKQVKQLSSNLASNSHSYAAYKSALRELDNSFIQSTRLYNGDVVIKFHNPSIQDFLLNYCNKDETIKLELVNSFLYLKPVFAILEDRSTFKRNEQRLILSDQILAQLRTRLIEQFSNLEYSPEIYRYGNPTDEDKIVLKLSSIDTKVNSENNPELDNFIVDGFSPYVYSENIGNKGVHAFSQLLVNHFSDKDDLDVEKILLNITPSIFGDEDFSILQDFDQYFPVQFQNFKENYWSEYIEIFSGTISELGDVGSKTKDELQQNIESLNHLESYYEVDVSYEVRRLEKAIDQIEEDERRRHFDDFEDDDWRLGPRFHPHHFYDKDDRPSGVSGLFSRSISEKENIENLFRSMDDE